MDVIFSCCFTIFAAELEVESLGRLQGPCKINKTTSHSRDDTRRPCIISLGAFTGFLVFFSFCLSSDCIMSFKLSDHLPSNFVLHVRMQQFSRSPAASPTAGRNCSTVSDLTTLPKQIWRVCLRVVCVRLVSACLCFDSQLFISTLIVANAIVIGLETDNVGEVWAAALRSLSNMFPCSFCQTDTRSSDGAWLVQTVTANNRPDLVHLASCWHAYRLRVVQSYLSESS